MANKFIKKNGKYYRINSDNTLTEVQLKDGHFYWVLPDKIRVKAKLDNNLTDYDYARELKGNNTTRFLGNLVRNPGSAMVDGALYLANKAGVPSNATNYLRDLNVALPYRGRAAVEAAWDYITGDESYSESYNRRLSQPGVLNRAMTIQPLTNDNSAFSDQEIQAIKEMAGKKSRITNSDIKRVSIDGKYGANGAISSYFSPTKVVQTSLGQTSGRDNILTDLFDVNVKSDVAKRDNQMYIQKATAQPGFNYVTLRATMPYTSSTDVMPDKYKIKTVINLDE